MPSPQPDPKGEIPWLCRGGSKSLTVPGVSSSSVSLRRASDVCIARPLLLSFTGCDQAPSRGQQP
jgi:hypothetical protein